MDPIRHAAIALLLVPLAAAQDPLLRPLHFLQPGDEFLDVELLGAPATETIDLYRSPGTGVPFVLEDTLQMSDGVGRLRFNAPIAETDLVEIKLQESGMMQTTLRDPVLVYSGSGDANLDDVVDYADVLAIFQWTSSPTKPYPFSGLMADVNGSSAVTVADAVYLYNWLQGQGLPPVNIPSGAETCPDGVPEADWIPDLIAALADDFSAQRADYAYRRLFHLGAPAVTDLIQAASMSRTGALSTVLRINHPIVSVRPSGVRVISAYLLLVEAMRQGRPNPYLYAELMDDTHLHQADDAGLLQAVADFQQWDATYAMIPLHLRPKPVLGAGVDFPLELAADGPLFSSQGHGWNKVQGSATWGSTLR